MNCMVENYLRFYSSYHKNDWDDRLQSAEFAYNSSISDDIGMSLFESVLEFFPRTSVDMVSRK